MTFVVKQADHFTHAGPVTALAFSPDGKTIASGSGNGVYIWDVASGGKLSSAELESDQAAVCRWLAFSPSGGQLVSVYERGNGPKSRQYIQLWSISSEGKVESGGMLMEQKRKDLDPPTVISRACFSSDGRMLACGMPDGIVHVWETATRKKRAELAAGIALEFSDRDNVLFAVSRYGVVSHWSMTPSMGNQAKDCANSKTYLYVENVAYDPTFSSIALSDAGTVCAKDARTNNVLWTMKAHDEVVAMAYSPDGKLLAIGECDRGILLVAATSGKKVAWIRSVVGIGCSLTFSADGKYCAWGERGRILIKPTEGLLVSKDRAPGFESTTPIGVSLDARIVVDQDTYELDLAGKSSCQFARLICSNNPPQMPQVKLGVALKNNGDKPIELRSKQVRMSFHLYGPGAMNRPHILQAEFANEAEDPSAVRLDPGKEHMVPIHNLDSWIAKSYWVVPGHYLLSASIWTQVSPSPKGADDAGEAFGYVTIRTAPVKLRIEKKRDY
ncbi:MAG: WD40 repeat domain-containing protein [Gemmataceae bacterium]|nr:WD40 repeat domain-containing protein [Gemmataceae bacterium]